MTQTKATWKVLGSKAAYRQRYWDIYRASLDGASTAEISERYNVTPWTVRKACRQWGHNPAGNGRIPRPWNKRDHPNERGLAILAHLRLGLSQSAVARKFGVTQGAVSYLARQWPQYCVPAVDSVEDVG